MGLSSFHLASICSANGLRPPSHSLHNICLPVTNENRHANGRTKALPYRESKKALANSKPICGVGYMPRRWRNFATQTTRRRLFSRRMPRGFPGGTPGRLFFRHFFATGQRNGIKANRSARAEGSQYERMATQKVKNSRPRPQAQRNHPPKTVRWRMVSFLISHRLGACQRSAV